MLSSVAEYHVGKRFSPDAEQVMDMLVSFTQIDRTQTQKFDYSIRVPSYTTG